ncbi:MAG: PSD1 and planctomycete cytochrome C domain-containing protein [Bryobacteraceae bacterium]
MKPFIRHAALLAALAVPLAAQPNGKVSFNRDIRPIMSDTCFRCHGPDPGTRMAGMRLDLRDEALRKTKSGIIPIVPGKPDESAIVNRIFTDKPALLMPPRYAHKELTAAQKETIRRWVAEGAEYQGHWAYEPVRRPATPSLSGPTIRNPIDAFIQDRLAREGLKPSPEADRRTLIRRVTLDLTGIPPTPAEIRAFLADTAPDAYEKLVDRLLASPRYAEKQAIHWLDAVRYADTCGFHGDNPIPAWPYRDYVLRAFRDNKPFDVFTREQLAGDLLPNATPEQKVASAYNRLSRMSSEGGVQPKEYLAKYAADRVRTTSTVWLGSTMGCAECHDHKFDPFTAKDFYSFKAFFADIEETGLVKDSGPEAWGSKLKLPDDEQARRREELGRLIEATREKITAEGARLLAADPERGSRIRAEYDAGRLSWQYQRPVSASTEHGAVLRIYNDEPLESSYNFGGSLVTETKPGNGIVVASGPNPDNETYTVTLRPGEGRWTAVGIEAIQDESLSGARYARGANGFVLTEVEAELSSGRGRGRKLEFSLATTTATEDPNITPAIAAIDGDPATGWGVANFRESQNPFLALRFSEPLVTTAKSVLTIRLRHDSDQRKATLGRFRLALSTAEYSWPGVNTVGVREPREKNNGLPGAVLKPAKDQSAEDALREFLYWTAPELTALHRELDRLGAELSWLEASIPEVIVTEATEPAETRILARGNWMDDTGEIVLPAVPGFLDKLNTPGRATRLDLANWLVSRDNPLTPRVWVNRTWRIYFGNGLSKVLDDLGSQGELPSHPELLDWLAAEFRENWNMKNIVRLIVTSHTYRQTSNGNPEAEAKDPDNRLLARQSRFRVDAEIVRDIALAVSGLLVEKFGGPSVRPPQPEGYLLALNFPKREYSADRGENQYRRGIYTHWQRTFLYPSLLTFDAPGREECTVNRVNSNTPLQALVLLNDPVFVEAARVFAQNILAQGGRKPEEQIAWAFEKALGREPSSEEVDILSGLHRRARAEFARNRAGAAEFATIGEAPLPDRFKPADLAAMTAVARAILNLHETITRN